MGLNLGLLLSAISGAGQGASAGLAEQQKAQAAIDIEQARQDADLQRQKAMLAATSQNALDTAAQQRQIAIADTQVPQGVLNSIIASNAQGNNPQAVDYTTPTDQTPATFEQMQPEDQTNPAFAPTNRQLTQAKIQQAIDTGHYDIAKALSDAQEKDVIKIGYGGQAVYVDPVTGEQTMLANSADTRVAPMQTVADARTVSANASMIKAQSIATATSSKDPVLVSLGNAAKIAQVRVGELLNTGAKPDVIAAAQGIADQAYARLVSHQNNYTQDDAPVAAPTVSPSKPFNPADFTK